MGRVLKTVAAVVVVIIVAAGAFLLWDNHLREYSVSYDLDGGTLGVPNPDTYRPGDELELAPPAKDGYYFGGWYLDSSYTERFDGDTSGLKGDIVLHALWTDSLVGTGITLTLSGTVENVMMLSYRISGTQTMSYVYLDPETGEYLIDMENDTVYDYGIYQDGRSSQDTYWQSEGNSGIQWTVQGTQEMDTPYGTKVCEIVVATYPDGSTETQWIMDGWIPYRVIYSSSGFLSSAEIVYTLSEVFHFDPPEGFTVTGYADDGITVEGSGTYAPGRDVVLTASADTGTEFAGWYDVDGNLISTQGTIVLDTIGSDTTVYAMNTTERDRTVSETDVIDLLDGGTVMDSGMVVDTSDGSTVMTFNDATASCVIGRGGDFYIVYDAHEADGTPVHRIFGVLVDGDVMRHYEWRSGWSSYSLDLTIDYFDVLEYRDVYSPQQRQQDIPTHERDRTFVTYDDPYVRALADELYTMTSGMDDSDRLNVVTAFTQYIEYRSDTEDTGYEEYWKFPLETLYDMGGDCEDTSILLAALMEAMGYDSALLLFPGHMATGVSADGLSGTYYPYGGLNYYYCETTATGYRVGDTPSNIDVSRATVVTLGDRA